MPEPQSVSELLGKCQQHDPEAREKLMKLCWPIIANRAAEDLQRRGFPRGRYEDDIAASTLESGDKRLQKGPSLELANSKQFFALLFDIVVKKVANLQRYEGAQKRSRRKTVSEVAIGNPESESSPKGFGLVKGGDRPEIKLMARETFERVLDRLKTPRDREIAVLTLMGHGAGEIVEQLVFEPTKPKRSTVERIRTLFRRYLEEENERE